MSPADVLYITKPLRPPFDDAGKNLAADILRHVTRYRCAALCGPTPPFSSPAVSWIRALPARPDRWDALRVARAVWRRREPIYHYYYAPNPVTAAVTACLAAPTRPRTVHTICSRPARWEGVSQWITADRCIALSEDTGRKLAAAGVPEQRIRVVFPGIAPPEPLAASQRAAVLARYGLAGRRVVLYPGDLEFSNGADVMADATAAICQGDRRAVVVFACRPKTPAAHGRRERLARRLAGWGDRVRFLGRVADMPLLAAASAVVCLPVDDLYAKMDVPLVLLEAMGAHVPVVASRLAPMEALFGEAAWAVPPSAPAQLAQAVTTLLHDDRTYADRAAACGQRVRDRFHIARTAAAVEAVYDELRATR